MPRRGGWGDTGRSSAVALFASAAAYRFSQVRGRRARRGSPWLFRDVFALAEYQVSAAVLVGDHRAVFSEATELINTRGTSLLYSSYQFRSCLIAAV